jgi:hypothetical protein
MTNELLINGENICPFPYILGSPSSYMTLNPIPSEFSYIWGQFCFLFLSMYSQLRHRVPDTMFFFGFGLRSSRQLPFLRQAVILSLNRWTYLFLQSGELVREEKVWIWPGVAVNYLYSIICSLRFYVPKRFFVCIAWIRNRSYFEICSCRTRTAASQWISSCDNYFMTDKWARVQYTKI